MTSCSQVVKPSNAIKNNATKVTYHITEQGMITQTKGHKDKYTSFIQNRIDHQSKTNKCFPLKLQEEILNNLPVKS